MAVGKTAVSSSIIDRVVAGIGRKLIEVPVGFKWFVDGLISGTIGFGGEESAGASFLRNDGTIWTTDKDGIILALLASEILAVTGKTPSQRYAELAEKYGAPTYARIDAPANREQKARLGKLSPEQVTATELAGEPITAKLTTAPGNGAAAGRAEGDDGERVVRRAAVGHRGRLQDLRRVVQGTRASGTGAGRRPGGGEYSHRVSSVAEGDCPTKPQSKLPSEVWVLIVANAVIALGYGVVAPGAAAVRPQLRRQHQRRDVRHHRVRGDAAVLGARQPGVLVQRLGERRIYLTGLLIVALSTGACAFAQTYWQLLLFRSLGGLGLGDVHRVVAGPDDPDLARRMPAAGWRACSRRRSWSARSAARCSAASPRVWGCPRRSSSTGSALLIAAAVVFFSLRHSSIWRAPAVQHRTGGDGAGRAAQPGLPGGAVVELRDGLVGVRAADRAGAAVRHRGAATAAPASPGLALATFAIGNVSAVIPSGYLSDRVGRRLLLIVGLTVSAVATARGGLRRRRCRCSWPVRTSPARRPGMFISPQQAAVADIIGSKARGGTAVATFQMMSDFGAILGSLAVGQIAQHLSFATAFVISGVILLVAARRLGVRAGNPAAAVDRSTRRARRWARRPAESCPDQRF